MSGRRRFAALLVAVLAGLLALVAGAAASQAAPAYTKHASISFSASGTCGHLTVNGEGFAPNEQVTLTLHTKTFTLTTVTTDADGNFSAAVTLPAGVDGKHTIDATGSTNDKASGKITLTNCAGTAGQGAGSGGLSNTGVAVLSIAGVGVLLLIGGTFLVVSGRRRRALV
jgi:5'-nucleotidase